MIRKRWERQIIVRFFFPILFFASGFAALGYQIVWSKMFAAGLGHEIPSVLATISALFFGMTAGAWKLDRVIAKASDPARFYAALECVIGLWGVVTAFSIPAVNRLALQLIGLEPSPLRHWAVAFLVPCLVLLPATFAMGATFPAMFRVAADSAKNRRVIGGIYGANTFGAVLGVLVTAFALLPAMPLRSALFSFAAINLAIAMTIVLARVLPSELSEPDQPIADQRPRPAIKLFVFGLLGVGFELWSTRMLSQVLENTIYTYATILAVFLGGLSVGGAWIQRVGGDKKSNLNRLIFYLVAAMALSSFGIVFMEALYARLREVFGDGRKAVLIAELVTSVMICGAPSFLMGAIYAVLVQRIADAGGAVGKAAALNTLGGALAAPLWIVFLLPLVGSKWVLVVMIAAYLILTTIQLGPKILALAGLALISLALPSNFSILRENAKELVSLNEGVMATVTVRQDDAGRRSLYVNHRFQMGGTGSSGAEQRHADIPLLLHGHAEQALFLGLGTGISMGAAAFYEGLRADGVELLPEVVGSLKHFAPENHYPQVTPNFRIYTADARRFVRCAEQHYDVIVADLFNPAHDGIGLLYSEEHFRAAKERLQLSGLFCQWLPLYQMDDRTLCSIIATFLRVFEHSEAFLLRFNVDTPVLGLVGSSNELHHSLKIFPASGSLSEHLGEIGLADSLRLFGCYLCGEKELQQYASKARINTDEFPHLIFDAPNFSYQRHAASYATLTNLLAEIPVSFPTFSSQATIEFKESLRSYIIARNDYLKGLVAESEGRFNEAVDLYIEASRLNSEFSAGYARCISIASSLAASEPQSAVALLGRLIEAQPERALGKQLLDRIKSGQSR